MFIILSYSKPVSLQGKRKAVCASDDILDNLNSMSLPHPFTQSPWQQDLGLSLIQPRVSGSTGRERLTTD